MSNFILNLFVNMVSVAVTAWVVPGIHAPETFTGLLVVAFVFGLVNAIVRPIMTVLSLPFILLTFGLFIFVMNGLLLLIVAAFTPLAIDGLLWAMVGAIVLSIVNMFLGSMVGIDEDNED